MLIVTGLFGSLPAVSVPAHLLEAPPTSRRTTAHTCHSVLQQSGQLTLTCCVSGSVTISNSASNSLPGHSWPSKTFLGVPVSSSSSFIWFSPGKSACVPDCLYCPLFVRLAVRLAASLHSETGLLRNWLVQLPVCNVPIVQLFHAHDPGSMKVTLWLAATVDIIDLPLTFRGTDHTCK